MDFELILNISFSPWTALSKPAVFWILSLFPFSSYICQLMKNQKLTKLLVRHETLNLIEVTKIMSS